MALWLTRYGIAVIVCAIAIVSLVVGGFSLVSVEGAAHLVGAGLSVWLFNWLLRIGLDGESERDDEREARAFLMKHGHWPDEPPPRR
jgi:hypothetical protein